MADVYEQNLAQKTSLTTSDYIRVVGSDNVSYKQGVANVKTAWGLNWHTYSSTTRADLLDAIDADLTALGQGEFSGYMLNTQATLLGLPNVSFYFTARDNSTNYRMIRFTTASDSVAREYILYKKNGTWDASPTLLPTRAEVDALGQKFTVTTSGQTFTISSGYRGILYITDSSTPRCGEYFVISTGAGAVSYKEVSSASDLTITVGTNSLTLTPTSGSRVVMFTSLQGTVS